MSTQEEVLEKVDSEPYTQLDIHLQQTIYGELKLFIDGQNFLNAGDLEFLPIHPRRLLFGIQGKT